jgi:ABC-type multidrug transport system permease subunit
MNKTTVVTVIGVIASIVIAWWLVGFVFSALAFVIKVIVVLVVAGLVFAGLRSLLSGSSTRE